MKDFEKLFLKGQVYYPYLYPATLKIPHRITKKDEEEANALQGDTLPIYPIPMTAQTCKKRSGFLFPKGEKEDGHGVRDSLLDWAVFSLFTNEDNRKCEIEALEVLHAHHLCRIETCKALMEPFKGYYRRSRIPALEDGRLRYIKADVSTRLQTHTGINRKWGIVERDILYSREVIEDGMRFWGTVKLPEELESAFTQLLEESTASNTGTQQNSSLFRIGTGRTRGLGAVKIVNRDKEQHELNIFEEQLREFKERLKLFNETLIRRAKDANIQDVKPFYFALTLHSPMILRDKFQRYCGVVDKETLAEIIDLSVDDVLPIYHAARLEHITGWQELWGTPRFKEHAIATGSVFLFGLSCEPNATLWHKLFTLEEEGMGERRADGFGRVMLSDPFHQEEGLR
jgi:CRISPR-associated protein Csx10